MLIILTEQAAAQREKIKKGEKIGNGSWDYHLQDVQKYCVFHIFQEKKKKKKWNALQKSIFIYDRNKQMTNNIQNFSDE